MSSCALGCVSSTAGGGGGGGQQPHASHFPPLLHKSPVVSAQQAQSVMSCRAVLTTLLLLPTATPWQPATVARRPPTARSRHHSSGQRTHCLTNPPPLPPCRHRTCPCRGLLPQAPHRLRTGEAALRLLSTAPCPAIFLYLVPGRLIPPLGNLPAGKIPYSSSSSSTGGGLQRYIE